MKKNSILGISIPNDSLEKILYTINKNIPPKQFFHIVSLNPEIMVEVTRNKLFRNVVDTAQIKIIDGVGVAIAVQMHYRNTCTRVTGVDLMKILLKIAGKNSLRVLFIGGTTNLANNLAKCYHDKYPKGTFVGLQAIKNIGNQKNEEMKQIVSIVTDLRPHFVFAAFGSPHQEIWLWQNRTIFSQSICMGVGQGFDVLSGRIKRAPLGMRKIGLEWLYRLITQPWRWRRQLKLPIFVFLVIKEYINEHLLHKKN